MIATMNGMVPVSVCKTDSRLHAINWFAALYRSVKLKFYRLSPVSSFVESFGLFPYLRFQIWFPSNTILSQGEFLQHVAELKKISDVSKRFKGLYWKTGTNKEHIWKQSRKPSDGLVSDIIFFFV
jgi:hypothetical protein